MADIIRFPKPDVTRYAEPAPQFARRTDFNAEFVKQAFVKSDTGEFAFACAVSHAIRTDARIRGALHTRTLGLFGSHVVFDPGIGTAAADVIAALEAGEFWTIFPEDVCERIFLDGLLLNRGFGELIWTWDELRQRWLLSLRWRDPQFLRYDAELGKWFLIYGEFGEEMPIEFGTGKWVLFQPYGARGDGLWYPLALLWLAKTFAAYDWGRRNEAIGRPTIVGQSQGNATDAAKSELARNIESLRQRLGIILPSGFTLQALDFGASQHETFQRRIEMINADVSILTLGQTLTTEVKGGSLAAEQGHETVRTDFKRRDRDGWATFAHDQVLPVYSDVRFNSREAAPWPVYQVEATPALTELVTVWKTGAEALEKLTTIAGTSTTVDVNAALKLLRVPLKETKSPGP